MTSELAEPQRWSSGRWWSIIGLVLATQLALIYWLGRPRHVVSLPMDLAPGLQLVGPSVAQMLEVNDPTLFALPHVEGFSGPAWLWIRSQEFRPFAWSEPPFALKPAQAQLGADFNRYMSTNQPDGLPVFVEPELKLKLPVVTEPELFPTHSTLRITGGLAQRRLLAASTLPAWPSAELLTNSVVQVLVAADGSPVSATLLKLTSGSSEADQYALSEARKTRFEPLNVTDPANPLEGLTWGQLVFEWHTLALTATNQPAQPAPIK